MLMLTGIMAMFEMATSFNSQQLQFRPQSDAYSGTDAQQADRDLLRLFSQDDLLATLGDGGTPWTGDELCQQLICKFNSNQQQDCEGGNSYDRDLFNSSPLQLNNYRPSLVNAESSLLACVMSHNSHRVLVVPNFEGQMTPPYRLYSCLTSSGSKCSFES